MEEANDCCYRSQDSVWQLLVGPTIHIDENHYKSGQCETPCEHHADAVPLKLTLKVLLNHDIKHERKKHSEITVPRVYRKFHFIPKSLSQRAKTPEKKFGTQRHFTIITHRNNLSPARHQIGNYLPLNPSRHTCYLSHLDTNTSSYKKPRLCSKQLSVDPCPLEVPGT